jgi:hypothetical protein
MEFDRVAEPHEQAMVGFSKDVDLDSANNPAPGKEEQEKPIVKIRAGFR